MTIPTNTPTIAVQPSPVANTSSGLTQLSNLFGNMSKSFSKDYLAQREKSAEESGVAAREGGDTQPASNRTPAGQAYNKGAEFADKTLMTTAVLDHGDELLNHAQNNFAGPDTITAYQESWAKNGQTLINQALPNNRFYVQNLINNNVLTGTQKLQTQARKYGRAELFSSFSKVNNVSLQRATDAAGTGDIQTAMGTYGTMANRADQLEANSVITPKQNAKYKNIWQEQIHLAWGMHGYEIAKDKEKFIEKVRSNGFPGVNMTPLQQQTMLSGIQKEINTNRALSGVTTASIKEKIKNSLFVIRSGGKRDANLENTIATNFPALEEDYTNKRKIAQSVGNEYTAAISGTVGDINGTIERLRLPLTQKELASPDARIRDLWDKSTAAALAQYKVILHKDPVEALKDDPAWQHILATNQANLVHEYPDSANPDYVLGHLKYQQADDTALLNLQTQKGILPKDQKLMTNEKAANLALSIKSHPFPEQPKMILHTGERYGKNAAVAFKQLSNFGLPQNAAVVAAMVANPKTRPEAGGALSAFQTPTKELEKNLPAGVSPAKMFNDVKRITAPYLDPIATRSGDTADTIKQVHQSVYQQALYSVQHDGVDAKTAVNNAFNAQIGDHYTTTSSRGHTLFIPLQDSKGQPLPISLVNRAGSALLKEVQNSPDDLLYPTNTTGPFSNLPQSAQDKLYSDGMLVAHLQVTPDDSGLEVIDRAGLPVRHENGTLWEAPFTDITDPDSQISKSMQKYPTPGSKLLKGLLSREGKPGPAALEALEAVFPETTSRVKFDAKLFESSSSSAGLKGLGELGVAAVSPGGLTSLLAEGAVQKIKDIEALDKVTKKK